MKMDISSSRFYVFVARDGDEFKRYSSSLHGVKGINIKGVECHCKKYGDAIAVVLSEEAKHKSEEVEKVCHVVAATIISLSENGNDVNRAFEKLDSKDKVAIFIHWGGQGWQEMERVAQEALKKSAYNKWEVFALSSERTDLGFVPGTAPSTKEVLEELVYNCEDAPSDEALTRWVIGGAGCDFEVIEKRLERLKNRLLLSCLKSNKKEQSLWEVQKVLRSIRNRETMPRESAPFLAKILNREVFHG